MQIVFTVNFLFVSVSLRVTIEAVFGGSVVLPCLSTEDDLELQDTNVHWRHNGSKIVYDIVKGKDSVGKQDPEYKKRATTFPAEYERRNFSIKLNNLSHDDTGTYRCLITPSDEQVTVVLSISDVYKCLINI